MSRFRVPALALALLLFGVSAVHGDWKPAPTPLMTKWGKQISADKQPWPEYPRPQMVRQDWLNLNGLWDYAVTAKDAPTPTKWDGQILVPFCAEAALSGVGKHPTADQNLWYHRAVEVLAGWGGRRVILRFDAVDWETTVFVNGKEVGVHRGGFDPFSFDITDALKGGKGELVVKVWDPTEKGSQPVGKQLSKPEGIWYTPVSGIWQTVWLEPVKPTHITGVRFTPDVDKGEVECVVDVANPDDRDEIQVIFGPVAPFTPTGYGLPGKPIRVKLTDVKLWTPDAPHLVPATVNLSRQHPGDTRETLDWATSYFAMRKVSAGKDENGVMRLMLNNKPLFQVGPLDQGWWPDGLLTPPSDEAMRYDLDVLKKLGLNMLRKHIKVEPSRLYHYCDTIGLLVWQDMPSAINRSRKQFVSPGGKDCDDQFTPAEKQQFNLELKAMIDHLRFFPCIYCWVPFNEGWGQRDTNDVLKWVKGYDPTRLVNGPSGWEDRGYGDMKDMHNYPGPGMFPAMPDRASVLGEFGGLGLPVKGHLWKDQGNWGYQSFKTPDDLRAAYHRLMVRLHPLVGKGLSAAVYTQTTDVEVEVNGLMTYDREVLKFDAAETAKWHKALFGPPPVVRDVVPTSREKPQTWRYTREKPAADWLKAEFDDKGWAEGPGGFGTRITPGAVVRTEWNTADIWLRRTADLPADVTGDLFLSIHHDEDAEVYVNGVLATRLPGYVADYEDVPISDAARKALKPGANVIAVHCHQTGGGQYIDVGLIAVRAK